MEGGSIKISGRLLAQVKQCFHHFFFTKDTQDVQGDEKGDGGSEPSPNQSESKGPSI